MGTAADYAAIVILVVLGAGVWTLLERVGEMQRDLDGLKRKLGGADPPQPEA